MHLPLRVRRDERTDRAVITMPEAYMAMAILTRLNLLSVKQIASGDVEPAGNCLHQLIAGDWEAIQVATTVCRVPGMRKDRGSRN